MCGIILCDYPETDNARNFRQYPIYMKGCSIAMDSLMPYLRTQFDWLRFGALINSSRQAYELAGIKNPREGVGWSAEIHDCFTITELAIYENFGFSPEGK